MASALCQWEDASERCTKKAAFSVGGVSKYSCCRCQLCFCSIQHEKKHRKGGVELCNKYLRLQANATFVNLLHKNPSVNVYYWFKSFAYDPCFYLRNRIKPGRCMQFIFESVAHLRAALEPNDVQKQNDAISSVQVWQELSDLGLTVNNLPPQSDKRKNFIAAVAVDKDTKLLCVPAGPSVGMARASVPNLKSLLKDIDWPDDCGYACVSLQDGYNISFMQAGPSSQHCFVYSWLQEQPSEWLQMLLFDKHGNLIYAEEKDTSTDAAVMNIKPMSNAACAKFLYLLTGLQQSRFTFEKMLELSDIPADDARLTHTAFVNLEESSQ